MFKTLSYVKYKGEVDVLKEFNLIKEKPQRFMNVGFTSVWFATVSLFPRTVIDTERMVNKYTLNQ